MNCLPDELLQHIFSFLSQRYISTCSIICKKWLVLTRDPQFYKTVHFYSEKQLIKFLDIATTLKLTKNNIPVGQCVSVLNIARKVYSMSEQLVDLYYACPNVTMVNGLFSDSFFPWSELNIIPFWFTNYDRSLSYNKRHDMIRSLNYTIKQINTDNASIIQIQTDIKKRRRSARYSRGGRLANSNNNNKSFVEHYGKTIFFLSPSSWVQLKSLWLVFNRDGETNARGGPDMIFYEFDERVLDTIRTTCPQLESLYLQDFYMNLSDDYLSTITSTTRNKPIHPHSSLKQLRLFDCNLNDILCFDYISKSYPNIIDLCLDCTGTSLFWMDYDIEGYEQYTSSLFNMVTQFAFLKKLRVSLRDNLPVENMLWSSMKLYQWLMDHPTQIEELDYPFDLLTIKNECLNKLQSPSSQSFSLPRYQQNTKLNHSLAYIRHLTTLTLHLENNLSQVLDYLQNGNHNNHVSLSITSLEIYKRHPNNRYDINLCSEDNDFFIEQWLYAFPSIKEMRLHGLLNVKKNEEERKKVVNHLQQDKQGQQTTYRLKKLCMMFASLDMTGDQLKEFFESCPFLRTLELSSINFLHTTKVSDLPAFAPPIKNEGDLDYMIIDIPHLHMDEVGICEPTAGKTTEWIIGEGRPYKSIVHEIGSKGIFEIDQISFSMPLVNIIVNCKSIDIFRTLLF
ncbi:hypothetical protein BJ944DRAFT_263717 [Cunninghamella echinulata]|nr:hypothetical protein BJ944DRAFT_263717 [Cunninghamella echinulata]